MMKMMNILPLEKNLMCVNRSIHVYYVEYSMCRSRRGSKGFTPPFPLPIENHQAIWLLSETGPDPQENHSI